MSDCFHLDYETRSLCDIKRTGAFKYAEDPSTEILCAAIARNDEEPLLWVNPKFAFDDLFTCRSSPRADELMAEMCAGTGPVYAHNAQFEHAITNHCPNSPFKVDIRRWRCTAAMSRRAAIPPSLEKAAETLKLSEQKDGKGKTLIRKFSVPQKKDGKFIEPIQKQEDFIAFCEYCLQDVRVEQGIHKALKHFELTGDILEAFLADLAINARGMPVNIPALRHAKSLIDAYEARLTEEFRGLTGFNPTQRDVLLKWLKENGYPGDNLRADTLDEQLESAEFDPSSLLGRALTIKKHLSFASIKKVGAMIECACEDGRVRGTLQFYGAGPGRASGRLVQPQNFKRPTIKNTDAAYADICAGEGEDHIELFYGPTLDVLGSCIRHFIHDVTGPIFDVDFTSIEARIAAWLAGEEWKLEVFRTHGKIYETTICRMTGMPLQEMLDYYEKHGKHHPDRQKGKVSDLALGFQGGPDALESMGRQYDWGVEFTEEELQEFILEYQRRADPKKPKIKTRAAFEAKLKEQKLQQIVDAWREANPNIVKAWYAYDRAAKNAVKNFGSRHTACRVEFFCATTAGAKYLFAKLPSGRRIAYRDPQISETVSRDKDGNIEYWQDGRVKTRQTLTYWGQIRDKTIWGRCAIYGGMWMQNFTEGVGADLLNNGILKSEKAGFKVFSLIHDQILTYKRKDQTIESLVACMTDVPSWAKGLPVTADGQVQPYYTK
jgi:DNA polymerase